MLLVFQIILVGFFALAALKAAFRFRAGELTLFGFIGWLFFWAAAAFIVLWPDSTFYLAKQLGVGRGADAVVYASIAALFFLVFRLSIKVERLKRETTKLARREALDGKNERL